VEEVDFREFIDKVLSRVDIVNVISRYLPLKKKGKTYWGCCPFHHEKEPSFAVNEAGQYYHCFGCHESGNAISFVQKTESVDFMDALRIVAEMARLEVPQFKHSGDKTVIDKKKKDRLLSLLRVAGRHYYDNLSRPDAESAREYIRLRGLSESIVRRFGLGYSVDGQEMLDFLTSNGYSLAEIREAGIAEIKGDRHYDVYYGRLIIPIINVFGETVGFGGRLLDKETHIPVKYRNTSATPVFDKSKIIFGINLLKKKKQKENIKYVIMTEGYMDVMSLHQAGFDTAVASMGTSLTYQQAKAIKNICSNVYISYDGDSAGQAATMRGLDILAECGLNVKVVSLPDGLDPDDLIKQRGRQAYLDLLKSSDTLPAFKIKVLLAKYDLGSPDGKSKFAVEAMKVIAALTNPVEKEEYLNLIRDYTGYSMDALRQQAGISEKEIEAQRQERDRSESAREEEKKEETLDPAQLFVVASIVHSQPYITDEDVFPFLTSSLLKEIYSLAIEKKRQGDKINPSALYSLSSGDVSSVVGYEFMAGDDEAKYRGCLTRIKLAYYTAEKARLSNEYAAATDNASKLKALTAMQKTDEKIKQLKYGDL
jgi:DNA primase